MDWLYNTLTDIYLRLRFMVGVWQREWHCVPTAGGAIRNMELIRFLWKDNEHEMSPSFITNKKSLRRPAWDENDHEDMRWMEYGRGFFL